MERAIVSGFTREKCEVKLVGTPLTHKRFLQMNRGTYAPAIQAGKDTNTNLITKITNRRHKENGVPKIEPKINIPTMRDIIASSKQQKLELKLQTLGPFFRITAKRLESEEEIGRADGIIRLWFGGKILHLDSIKLSRETLGMEKSIFGIGVFLGAVAIRYGYDCGCTSAELLAINDSDLYHKKVCSVLCSKLDYLLYTFLTIFKVTQRPLHVDIISTLLQYYFVTK